MLEPTSPKKQFTHNAVLGYREAIPDVYESNTFCLATVTAFWCFRRASCLTSHSHPFKTYISNIHTAKAATM
jgi:hypothetical protein